MKTNALSSLLALALATAFLASCDVIEAPYRTESNRVETRDTLRTDTVQVPVQQYVLLEDFTGFLCGNCPAAGDILKELHHERPVQLVPLKIHVGPLATPNSRQPYEYRTPTGNEIDARFNVSPGGIPRGMVDRREFGGSLVLNKENWRAAVEARLNESPQAMIRLHAMYDEQARKIDVQARYEALAAGDLRHRLALFVVEDSIVSVQVDYRRSPSLINPYTHNSTLRGAINGSFGEPLRDILSDRFRTRADNSLPAGTVDYVGYRYDAPAEWKLKNCQIVAVLYDESGAVIQSMQAPIRPGVIQ